MTDWYRPGPEPQSGLGDRTVPRRPLDDELLDEVIADVAYIDAHRPGTPIIWLLRQQVGIIRDLTEWTERIQRLEHGPQADSTPLTPT